MISIIYTFTFLTPPSRLGNNYQHNFHFFASPWCLGNNNQHSCCFHFLAPHHLCNGISPIENSQIIYNGISPIENSQIICNGISPIENCQIICNGISPIENSPFQNWSSSTFSTSGFSRLFLIRILFFNLERWGFLKKSYDFTYYDFSPRCVFIYPLKKVMI